MTAYYNLNLYSGAACPAKAPASEKQAAGFAAHWRALRGRGRKAAQLRCAHSVLAVAACVVGVPAGILGGVAAATALIISPLALVLGW